MVAPFPPEVDDGRDPAESEALNLYANFAWLARLADEMDDETTLDLKKVYQIVLHARKFRDWLDALQARIGTRTAADIGGVILAAFGLRKVVWASVATMNTDLQSIYTDCGTVSAWADANAAAYKTGFSTNTVVSDDVTTDVPVTITKTTQIATFLTNFRANWGARGA